MSVRTGAACCAGSRTAAASTSAARLRMRGLRQAQQAATRLFGGAALAAQHPSPIDLLQNGDRLSPFDDSVSTSAAHRRAGHLASFSRGVRERDILGVHVYQAIAYGAQPFVRVLAGEIRVAGVIVE